MTDDTLDRLTPIGREDDAALPTAPPRVIGPPPPTVKRGLNHHAEIRTRYREIRDGAAQPTPDRRDTYGALKPMISAEDHRRMTSNLLEQFYGELQGEQRNAQVRKTAATAYSQLTDKLVILRGEPDTPPGTAQDAEHTRPQLLALVRRLAALETDTPVESQ